MLAAMAIEPLLLAELPAATELLAAACPFDRAAEVAHEKLFGAAPSADDPPHPLGYWKGGELAGVACVSGNRLRLLAVAPAHRQGGLGSELLARCEQIARERGAAMLHVLDQPGNYLAPGVDVRNAWMISFLLRRGYVGGERRANLLVDLVGNPKVTAERAAAVADAVRAQPGGYQLRRAALGDLAQLTAGIDGTFGGAWSFEVERALRRPGPDGPGVHLALRGEELCAFAAHDGNNSGLGWFGPAGTWPAHRGRRLGEALLLACLRDIARTSDTAEIAWIGPEGFYESSCGVAGRRMFLPMKKALR